MDRDHEHGPTIDVAIRTHVGHVRQRNEDCAVLDTTVVQGPEEAIDQSTLAAPLLVAALDGLGGHPDGDVASRVAGQALADRPDRSDLHSTLVAAHESVLAAVDEGRGAPGMGTTITLAVVHEDEVTVGSVGDSSILRIGETTVDRLTPLDRAAFGGLTSFAGITDTDGIEPHVRRLSLDGALRLLLATDGLTDELQPAEVHRLAHGGEPAAAATALVDAALEAGGHDNVTVAVIDVSPATRRP